MAVASLVVDIARAERLAPAWDRLALACSEPTSAPSWMLGWWRHAAPPTAELRIVAVHDGDELTGLVPLYVDHPGRTGTRAYRLLTGDFSSAVTPLARPGHVWDAAAAAAELLATIDDRPASIALAPMPVDSVWRTALRECWPGAMRPVTWRLGLDDAPTVDLRHASFDDWLRSRSANFRASARRRMNAFHKAGGVARVSTAATLDADIDAFVRLHEARWRSRGAGESRLLALGERLPLLVAELAEAWHDSGRFRLWMLELDGEPISADLSIAAGGEVVGVNVGWDERFRRMSPPQLSFLFRIRDAIERGDRRLSLGRGTSAFKQSFADGSAPVAQTLLVPGGASLPRALARATPRLVRFRARSTAARVLSDEQLAALRSARRRVVERSRTRRG